VARSRFVTFSHSHVVVANENTQTNVIHQIKLMQSTHQCAIASAIKQNHLFKQPQIPAPQPFTHQKDGYGGMISIMEGATTNAGGLCFSHRGIESDLEFRAWCSSHSLLSRLRLNRIVHVA